MALQHPDYLLPFEKENREEVILLPFHNVIRSENEAIFQYMKERSEHYLPKYPGLAALMDETADNIYKIAVSFSPEQFLDVLSIDPDNTSIEDAETISPEEISNDLLVIRNQYNLLRDSTQTRMEAAISQIVQQSFCKSLYVVDDFVRGDKSLIYTMNRVFAPAIALKKLRVYENTLQDIIHNHPEVTTVFIDDADDLRTIIETYDSKLIAGKYFMLSLAYHTNLDSVTHIIKHFDFFESAKEKYKCNVEYYMPFALDKEEHY